MRRSHPHPDGVGLVPRLRRGAAPSQVVPQGEAWLNSQELTMPSGPATGVAARQSWPGAAISCNSGSRRLEGPTQPSTTGSGTETEAGIYDFAGRLERLAFPASPVAGAQCPPLETYTVTTTEHGDVYRATDEYVRWFRSRYPKAGREDRASRPGASGTPQKVGRGRWKQNDLAP